MNEDKTEQQGPVIPEAPPGPDPKVGGAPARRGPDFLELVYGILFSPRKTFRELAEAPPVGQAVAVFLAVNIVSTTLMTISLGSRLSATAFGLAPAAFVFAGLVLGLIDWFVVTAVFHLVAEMLGGKGRGLSLFYLVALANLPRLINAPLMLLTFTPARTLEVLLSLAVTIWVAVLYIIAVAEVHHITSGQATVTVVLPMAAVFAVVAALIIAFAGLAALILPMIPGGLPLLPQL
ncbi:MAG TPA: Yip1 family protein [Bacillota bacterium]